MTGSTELLDQLRDQLVRGIPNFERRRRRARWFVATTGALLLLAASTTAFLLLRTDAQGDRVVTDSPPPTEAPTTEADPQPEPLPNDFSIEEFSSGGIPALLFASNVNGGAVAAIDLEDGFRGVYPRGTHTISDHGGAVDSAVLTSNDRLITGTLLTPTLVYPAEPTGNARAELVDGGLQEQGREIGTIGGERTAVPTDGGEGLWILASGDADDKPLEFVDLETGDMPLSTTVPPGSRLAAAIGDRVVIHPAYGAPTTEVLVMSPSGDTTTLEAPEPATFVAATPAHSVWLAGVPDTEWSGDKLLIVDNEGGTTEVPTPDYELAQTGRATIPSNSPPMPSLSADGTRLLLARIGPTRGPNGVVLIDIETGTTELLYGDPDFITAFWARDDRTVIVIDWGHTGVESERDDADFCQCQTVTAIDTITGETTTIEDALPDGFLVIAGR
jgi:hypothetical protein